MNHNKTGNESADRHHHDIWTVLNWCGHNTHNKSAPHGHIMLCHSPSLIIISIKNEAIKRQKNRKIKNFGVCFQEEEPLLDLWWGAGQTTASCKSDKYYLFKLNVILAITLCVCVSATPLCIAGTFNQDDRQKAILPAIYLRDCSFICQLSASSPSHIHTFILSFSFSECQLIFLSLSIQVGPPSPLSPSLSLSHTARSSPALLSLCCCQCS